MIYSTSELVELARVYLEETHMTASRLSVLAAGHNRLFERLFEGYDCRSDMLERASAWFDDNWPENLAWPESVKRRCAYR